MEYYKGNNAYRVKIKEREERRLERRDNPGYEKFVRAKKKKIIGSMLIIMAVALTVILRYAQISVLNNEIQMMQKRLDTAESINANLEIERDRIIDLANIEEIATKQYGMKTPSRDQIVYITVSRGDSVRMGEKSFLASVFNIGA